jgi:hypothetical protein
MIELREKLSSKGLDCGAHTIAWYLSRHHQVVMSGDTRSSRGSAV